MTEAARLTETSVGTARSWFKSHLLQPGKLPLLQSDYAQVEKDFAISFQDLIDLHVTARLREEGVSLQSIRKAHRAISNRLNSKHPFCHDAIYTDGKNIFLGIIDEVGEEDLENAISHQLLFPNLKMQLEKIDYDHVTKLAKRWRIANGVIIDPKIHYGKPVIENTGIATSVLADQFYANGNDAELIADLYETSIQDVLNAVQFQENLHNKPAA